MLIYADLQCVRMRHRFVLFCPESVFSRVSPNSKGGVQNHLLNVSSVIQPPFINKGGILSGSTLFYDASNPRQSEMYDHAAPRLGNRRGGGGRRGLP